MYRGFFAQSETGHCDDIFFVVAQAIFSGFWRSCCRVPHGEGSGEKEKTGGRQEFSLGDGENQNTKGADFVCIEISFFNPP